MANIALITGGSAGIGFELAKVFASHSYDLALVARNEAKLNSAAEQLRSQYRIDVKIMPKDLGQVNAAQEIYEQLQKENIRVDVLVNNAGFALYGKFVDQEPKALLEMMNLNMNSLVLLTRLLLPEMLANKDGKILNVSSTAAFQPGPLMSVYYASKSFVLSFSEALRAEMKQQGIHVTALCPGATKTEFFSKQPLIQETNLLKRIGFLDPQKVAEAGYRGLIANKSVVIPGISHKALAFATRLSPRNLVTAISHWTLKKS